VRHQWPLSRQESTHIDYRKASSILAQRVTEYVRGALPLFSPLTDEYNGNLCELGSAVLMANGGFGPEDQIPDSLLGKNVEFSFKNPLMEAQEKIKGGMLLESSAVLTQLAQYDPAVPAILDAQVAARDVIDGIGAPRKWFRTQEQVQEIVSQQEQEMEAAKMIAGLTAGGEAAKAIGEGGAAIQQVAVQ